MTFSERVLYAIARIGAWVHDCADRIDTHYANALNGDDE